MADLPSARQQAVRSKGQSNCAYHHGNKVIFECETCNELGCLQCLYTVHRNHVLGDLSIKIAAKKENIQQFIEHIEKKDLLEVRNELDWTDNELKNNSEHFANHIIHLTEQGNRMKEEIDAQIAKFTGLYKVLEEENALELKNFKEKLHKRLQSFEKHLQKCKEFLQTGGDVEIYDFDIPDALVYPFKPSLKSVRFTPNDHFYENLEKAFGTFEHVDLHERDAIPDIFSGSSWSTLSNDLATTRSIHSETNKHLHEKRSQPEPVSSKNRLLPKAKVITEGAVSSNFGNTICTDQDDRVWVTYSDMKGVILLHRNGLVYARVSSNLRIRDISVSPTTQTLWACSADNWSVMDCSLSKNPCFRFQFFTNDRPVCLCATHDNRILIGTNQKLTKFTLAGRKIISTKLSGTENFNGHNPVKISECRVSQNIAILDLSVSDENTPRRQVLVMNKNFEILFKYTDDMPILEPTYISYDSHGSLVIADRRFVHLVSDQGKHISVIHSDSTCISAMGLDQDNIVWIVTDLDKVKLLQYYRDSSYGKSCTIS
ncbi:uncharacterized protein LOC110465820 [Mizuhopecten yessoensis]|uniref:uncharacterized protein LOC110465820 n=1 Tax=Mizuhopecten yessoensis TaxID=6573 RepID=UPI000B45D283|nr:uncharacterized protein LOC110465820 [Mizuhopecten yessoensis]